jgi:peroxiredoxin
LIVALPTGKLYLMEQGNGNKHNLILLMLGSGLMLVAIAAFLAIPKAQEIIATADVVAVPLAVDFPAPDIQLTDLQARPVAFSDYKGQVILYNAWATWCPPCKDEMPILEAYYREHRQDGFVVIAIEDGQPLSEVAAYVKDYGLTFPVWPDLKWVATNAFRVGHLPASYVIDRNGTVRLTWVGIVTRDMLEQYVTPLIKER